MESLHISTFSWPPSNYSSNDYRRGMRGKKWEANGETTGEEAKLKNKRRKCLPSLWTPRKENLKVVREFSKRESKSYIILLFQFRSLIHLELILVQSRKSRYTIFQVKVQLTQCIAHIYSRHYCNFIRDHDICCINTPDLSFLFKIIFIILFLIIKSKT